MSEKKPPPQISSRLLKLQSDFYTEYHELGSRKDVRSYLEKLINLAGGGGINRQLAATLLPAVNLAYNMAKDLERPGESQTGEQNASISMTKTETLSIDFSKLNAEEVDAFLRGTQADKVAILSRLKNKNQGPLLIDARAISDISKETNTPISASKVVRLFGKNVEGAKAIPAELLKKNQTPSLMTM